MKPREKLGMTGAWTRPDDYLGVFARRRTARRARERNTRTQPESPRALLSTVPFLLLLGLLAILAVAIMVMAFPGAQPRPAAKPPASQERGVASRGWFQEAQKEMRH